MVTCQEVLQELSNYIDDTVEPGLREQIMAHLRMCHRCSIVHDTTRKTLLIYSDEGVLEVPAGYSERLRQHFKKSLQ